MPISWAPHYKYSFAAIGYGVMMGAMVFVLKLLQFIIFDSGVGLTLTT